MIKKIVLIFMLLVLLVGFKNSDQNLDSTPIQPGKNKQAGNTSGKPYSPLVSLPWVTRYSDTSPDWTDVPWGPFKLEDPPGITNPILTAEDATDRDARTLADPFLFYEDGQWFMFLEVFDRTTDQGDIGLARSPDGLHWSYEKIVLDEPFHLSYPYVFKVEDEYYMLPETYHVKEVRLYKSDNFPYDWKFHKTLFKGREFVDPSIFWYGGRWWIFVGSTDKGTLYLYSSDSLTKHWTEHPMSPIIHDDTGQARPGGRAFVYNGDQIIRIAQGWGDGIRVRAYQVTRLDKKRYEEVEIPESPLLEPGPEPLDWYVDGIHHFAPWWTGEYWIIAYDGRAESHDFSIGIKISTQPSNTP